MWHEYKQYNQRSVRNDKNTFKGHLQHIEKERNINNIFLNKHQFLDRLHILWAYATHAIHNRILTHTTHATYATQATHAIYQTR